VKRRPGPPGEISDGSKMAPESRLGQPGVGFRSGEPGLDDLSLIGVDGRLIARLRLGP
jgi:hypothetical protein